MKIVATIEENEAVNVKRFENDILIGERNVSVADYCYSLASELPIGVFIKHLLESPFDVAEYISNISDFADFSAFMSMFISKVSPYWYSNDEAIITMCNSFIARLDNVKPTTPEVDVFVSNLVKALPTIELNTTYYSLFLELLKKIISINDEVVEVQVRRAVYHNIVHQLQSTDIEEVKSTISNVIPHLDHVWFSNMVLEAQKVSTKPITYYSGKMPKNVDYVFVNAKSASFVYDVPKQLLETTFKGAKIGKIGYPRLLFIYTLTDEGTVDTMRLFAAKEGDELNDAMAVYEYPYSHVFNSGRVCWNYSDITIDMLPIAHELFLGANNSTHSRENVLELFTEQKDKSYDEDKLKFIGKLGNVL